MNFLAPHTQNHQSRLSHHHRPPDQPVCSLLFFPFRDGAILLHPAFSRLWFLNKTAAVIWCLLEEGCPRDNLAEELSRRFAVDQQTAEHDVKHSLARLRREGLLRSGGGPWLFAGNKQEETATAHQQGPEVAPPAAWCKRRAFDLGGSILEFCSQDVGSGRVFHGLLRHLAAKGEPAPDARLWVLMSQDRPETWDICLDGRQCFAAQPAGQVLPSLLAATFLAASRRLGHRLLLHAAVLRKGGTALLLPAEAGCGKTTLAAALAARGWVYYSDEMAVVDPQSLRVSPLPLPMSVKTGSLTALAPFYPELADQPEHRRIDGRLVRYLLPPAANLPAVDDSAPVGRIIFPKFDPDIAGCQATALSSLEALQKLAATGSSDQGFMASDIRALTGLVEQGPCLSLNFSDLTRGLNLIEDLMAAKE